MLGTLVGIWGAANAFQNLAESLWGTPLLNEVVSGMVIGASGILLLQFASFRVEKFVTSHPEFATQIVRQVRFWQEHSFLFLLFQYGSFILVAVPAFLFLIFSGITIFLWSTGSGQLTIVETFQWAVSQAFATE